MWWYRPAWAACALAALMAVAGCGFRPLHEAADPASGVPGVSAATPPPMALAVPSGWLGRELRLRLMERLDLPDSPSAESWRLELRLHVEQEDLLIQPDAEVTRRNYILFARVNLLPPSEEEPTLTFISRTSAAYNRVRSEFANIAALRDAERRATVVMADDIALRLSVFFARNDRQESEGEL